VKKVKEVAMGWSAAAGANRVDAVAASALRDAAWRRIVVLANATNPGFARIAPKAGTT